MIVEYLLINKDGSSEVYDLATSLVESITLTRGTSLTSSTSHNNGGIKHSRHFNCHISRIHNKSYAVAIDREIGFFDENKIHELIIAHQIKPIPNELL
ncbi:TPA: hypothetical protein ACXIB2_003306 [Proteus mirabilis]|uniref:hypothetical protein n=1 Tax=Proteus mirabilis TaxID=584 RepID=UPI001BA05D32|nr:hypothetical protein [Proteus mirabilis]MDM3632994.1 hypothetical protein [Proteus mirabilis]HBC5513732.1 hypothetical protein [Proteus mirabilis]HBC5903209.1 hypothetical protein [Proteus mirabilis]